MSQATPFPPTGRNASSRSASPDLALLGEFATGESLKQVINRVEKDRLKCKKSPRLTLRDVPTLCDTSLASLHAMPRRAMPHQLCLARAFSRFCNKSHRGGGLQLRRCCRNQGQLRLCCRSVGPVRVWSEGLVSVACKQKTRPNALCLKKRICVTKLNKSACKSNRQTVLTGLGLMANGELLDSCGLLGLGE